MGHAGWLPFEACEGRLVEAVCDEEAGGVPTTWQGGAHDGTGHIDSRMEGVEKRGGPGAPPRESPGWLVGTGNLISSSATGSPFSSTSVTTPPPTAPPATPTSRRPTSSSSPPAPTRLPVTPMSPAPPPTPSPSTSKFSTRQDRSCSWEWDKTQKQSKKKTQPGRHGLVRITRFDSGLPAKSFKIKIQVIPGSSPAQHCLATWGWSSRFHTDLDSLLVGHCASQ